MKERGVKKVKKRLLVFVLAVVMLFSMAVPAMATTQEALPVPIVMATGYDSSDGYAVISPFNEQTTIYWRTWNGQLQFRVWGVTSARWLTPWTNA